MAAVLRCDLLAPAMNARKAAHVRALLHAYRAGAVLVAREQWRLFFETGRMNKFHRNPDEHALAQVVGAANRVQMVRGQVVGLLDSFLENRANDFARAVQTSTLPAETQHQLHTVNRWGAWFSRAPLTLRDGPEISPEVRHLNAVLDRRAASVADAKDATAFSLWCTLSTMTPGQRVAIPLQAHDYFRGRQGLRKATVQLNEDRDGRFTIGVITDISAACAASRAAYTPRCEEVALDWGMRTLFGTDRGDLLGRGFLDRLRYYDARITRLAQYRASRGLRVRSPRYDREVRRLRGFLRETIHRVLNRVVERDAPARLVVERLWFRRPELSRRMNRLVTTAGRAIVRAKLRDLEETASRWWRSRRPTPARSAATAITSMRRIGPARSFAAGSVG